MRTLALTSPQFMHGEDVADAQRKMISGKFLRVGQDDGQYGPETARAAQTAHYWLGFAGKLEHAQTYGATLDRLLRAFIRGDTLPGGYHTRRQQRLRALAAQTVGEKAVAWLLGHVGETEQPAGSNRVEWASEWYGVIGPWCAMAVTRAFVEAGSAAFKRGQRYAYVPYIVSDATRGLNYLSRTFQPRKGDLVCYDWDGDGVFDHVGIVDNPPSGIAAGTPFTSVEGNTSFDDSGDQSNGGACAHRHRTILSGGRCVFVEVRK